MKRHTFIKWIGLSVLAQNKVFGSSISERLLTDLDVATDYNHLLWYKEPGRYWNSQALHIGNGGLGISFLGGIGIEKFAITDKTLWTGGPGQDANYNFGIKPGGKDNLQKIRQLITANEIDTLKEADALVSAKFMGDTSAFGYFSAYGILSINFTHGEDAIHYTRRLSLANAIGTVAYEIDGIRYQREYFCSYPHNAAVYRFTASQKGAITATLQWELFQKQSVVTYQNNIYEIKGTVNSNQQKFSLKLHIVHTGGKVYLKGNDLVIDQVDELTIRMASATEYDAEAPLFKGSNPEQRTGETIGKIKAIPYAALKKTHIADHKKLYNRTSFTLKGNRMAEALPTNERWGAYKTKQDDVALKVLYFNLSRYLLIASSRKGFLPANLQGGWNMTESAQWSGNYQSNINLQMNYYSANAVGLDDCMQPYIDWIKSLEKPGQAVAQAYYGTDGWVSHTVGNIWGHAAPGSELIWGMFPMGSAWHCHYLWRHFAYTQDKNYLIHTAYPLLKGATQFWLQNLTPYQGKLIVAPSVSAEHGAFIRDGKLVASGSSFGQDVGNIPCAYQDIQMLTDLFQNTIEAAKILQTDSVLIRAIESALAQLMPLKIGRLGQLQEWEADIDDPECNHRHIAHLYAVWPAKEIGPDDNTLTNAVKKTLELRGEARQYKAIPHSDIYTAGNWSLALRMICRIRLHEAAKADKLFNDIINVAGFENLLSYNHVPAGKIKKENEAYFTTAEGEWYPVWQIDTSLALAGFMAEMLLQTDKNGIIQFLPALPAAWQEGSIKGLKAEGNLTVDLEWQNGKVRNYKIYSPIQKIIQVKINGQLKTIRV